jgi:calcium binding protein 39
MESNQAFAWLMKSAVSALLPSTAANNNTSSNAIEGCNDISILVNGVSRDFFEASSASSSAVTTSGGGGAMMSDNDSSPDNNVVPPTENNNHLQNLTARLDRIKTLLYEERSASSAAVTNNNGQINLNWTPAVATEVFKCFTHNNHDTATTTTSDDTTTMEQQQDQDLLPKLVQNLPSLPFEARKSISAIFNYLLVCGLDGVDALQFASVSTAFGMYVLERASLIIGTFVHCHDCKSLVGKGSGSDSEGGGRGDTGVDITLLCGSMLRSSLRHKAIYQWVLNDANCEQLVYPFLDEYVHDPNFDVSSDALETVRVMFTGLAAPSGGGGGGGIDGYNDDADTAHEEYKQQMESIAAEFLERKYDPIIIDRMNNKCISSNANYMTRRMSLQLLSTILLNRSNFNVMMRYISSSQNLVTILCLLRDPSPHITLDAFQVFKIFVANPGKPPEVVKILFDNKFKLIKYLSGLHKEREGSDEQYRDEKGLVIATLEGLELES